MNRNVRDPYMNWKLTSIVLAVAVLVLALTAILIPVNDSLIIAALLLGAAMCAVSGMMAFSKERRVLGYLCSILAGVFLVLMVGWIARLLLW